MITTIQDFNSYISNRFGFESWIVVSDSKEKLQGTVSCLSSLLEFSGKNTLFTQLSLNSVLAIEDTVYKVSEIISNTKLKIEQIEIPNFIDKPFYLVTESEYTKQKKLVKALITAENQLFASQDWIVPKDSQDPNIKHAIYEWAVWLLNGGKSEFQKDQEQGIIEKKIDVLNWKYTGKYIKPGPQEAWKLLDSYENPNYLDGENFDTTFTMR